AVRGGGRVRGVGGGGVGAAGGGGVGLHAAVGGAAVAAPVGGVGVDLGPLVVAVLIEGPAVAVGVPVLLELGARDVRTTLREQQEEDERAHEGASEGRSDHHVRSNQLVLTAAREAAAMKVVVRSMEGAGRAMCTPRAMDTPHFRVAAMLPRRPWNASIACQTGR